MAHPCLYDGDFIDLTEEIDSNSQKKEVVRIAGSVSTGKNINLMPVVSAQELNFKTNGEARDISIPFTGNNVLLVVDQATRTPVTDALGLSESDIILIPSPSEVRQKKFPIDTNNEKICSEEDVIIVPNQIKNTPQGIKNQMAILTPIVTNQKQPTPAVSKGNIMNVVRKKDFLKKTKDETQKIDTQTSSLNRKIEEVKRNESTTSSQKQSQIVIQSVFTVSEGSLESQTAHTENDDIICLSDEETPSSRQKPQTSEPKILGVHSSGTVAIKQTQGITKQIPLDAQKLFNGQEIVPIALDKSQISRSIEDIVETVSAVGAITPNKEGENKPVYLLLYPLESDNSSSTTHKDGQVNKVLALVPINSELSSKNLSGLKLQNSQTTVLSNSTFKKILPVAKDVNQSKSTTPILKSTLHTKNTNQQKELPAPSLSELNNRHSYPPNKKIVGVVNTPPKNNSTDKVYQAVGTAFADPLVIVSPTQTKTNSASKKISPPREVVQIIGNTLVIKNPSKLSATKMLAKDPVRTVDNFIMPSSPAPRKKTVYYTSQIVTPVPSPAPKAINAVNSLSKGSDEDVQIEDPCVVTPVDITEILNQGVKREIKGRCQYQRFKSEDSLFKGFTTRQTWKASCAKELTGILKEETKKVAEWKKLMKQKYESNFVACGGSASYFLPENVKTEVDVYDLTDDSLPTISEVISQVNKEVLQLKESQRKSQINAEVAKRNEALQLIKQGLEMMKRWSQESTQPDLVCEIEKKKSEGVEETVTGKRQRKTNRAEDVQIEPLSMGRQRRVQIAPVRGKDVEVKKAPPKRKGVCARKSRMKKHHISEVVETKAVETENVVVKRRKTVKKASVDLNTGNDSDDLLMVKRVDIIKHNKVTTRVRRRK